MKNQNLGLVLLIIGIFVMLLGYVINSIFYAMGSFIVGVALATIIK